MKLANFAQILALTAALSAYSAWVHATRPTVPASTTGVPATTIPLIRLAEAEALWQQSATVFLDVRTANDYAYGHIRGALLLPEEDFETRFPELRPRLERAQAIVVYCGSRDCGKSLWTALRLWNAGLHQVKIYPAGWNEWYLRQLPSHRTATR